MSTTTPNPRQRTTLAVTVIGATVLLVVLAVRAATECDNKAPSNLLETTCVACTDNGPVARNNGKPCTYYTANMNVFCDCAPGVMCDKGTPIPVRVCFFVGGTCDNMACTNAHLDSAWDCQLPLRLPRGCR